MKRLFTIALISLLLIGTGLLISGTTGPHAKAQNQPLATVTPQGNAPEATTVTPLDCNAGVGPDDLYEDDDGYIQAFQRGLFLNVGAPQSHTFCPFGDQDWTQITLDPYTIYQIQTQNIGPSVSTTLEIFATSNPTVRVARGDATAGGASIITTTDQLTTFYVRVADAAGRGGIPDAYRYNLSLLVIGTTTPVPTPTVTTTPTASATSTAIPSVTPTGTTVPLCVDQYEPDNSRVDAKPIRLGESQRHAFCPAEDRQDWVRFQGTTGDDYIFQTSDIGVGVSGEITVFAPNGAIFQSTTFSGGGLAQRVEFIAPATGLYYVQIFNRAEGGLGSTYTINFTSPGFVPGTTPTITVTPSVTATPLPSATPCLDAYEDDGVPENAKLLLVNSTQDHLFCPSTDADWLYFYARPGKIYRVILQAQTNPAGLDPYIYIFDNDRRTIIAQSDDFNGSLFSGLDFLPPRDTTYYLQIKNYGDVGGSAIAYRVSLIVAPVGATPPGFMQTATAQAGGAAPTFTAQALGPTFTQPPANLATLTASATTSLTPLATVTATLTINGAQQTATAAALLTLTATVTASPTITATRPPANVPPLEVSVIAALTEQPLPTEPPLPPLPNTGKNLAQADMVVQVYVDRNGNGQPDPGEGLRGLSILYYDQEGKLDAQSATDRQGYSSSALFPQAAHQVTIPYLGIVRWVFQNVQPRLASKGEQARAVEWSIGLPAPILPQRIP